MTRPFERWHRKRMSELDMMQLPHTDALRPKLAHSVPRDMLCQRLPRYLH